MLRYSKLFSIPRKVVKHLLSGLYPVFLKIYKLPHVSSVEETLELINTNRLLSLIRFGDGEILYLTDKLNLPFQKYDDKLANCLKEILHNKRKNILVGLPIGYYSLETMSKEGQIFWRSQIVWNYPRFKKYLSLDSQYANASVTRLYYGFDKSYAKSNFNTWKSILKGETALIVEGEKTRFGVGNDLLSNIQNISRILGPKHNAFEKSDEIIKYVLALEKRYDLILIALGPAAKYIVYHLHLRGYRVLDIGNLDIEYEWYLRGVKDRILIPGKYTSEVKGGREVEDIDNPEYTSQIIAKFL